MRGVCRVESERARETLGRRPEQRARGGAGVLGKGVCELGHAVVEGVLGAVAVVDIEVDDRNTSRPLRLRNPRADRHIGEHAKPHGLIRLGMVTRRANGAKGAISFTRHHGPHSLGHGACRQISRLNTARRKRGVRIEKTVLRLWRSRFNGRDVAGRVDPPQIGETRPVRQPPVAAKTIVLKRVQNSRQPGRPLGMTIRRLVV